MAVAVIVTDLPPVFFFIGGIGIRTHCLCVGASFTYIAEALFYAQKTMDNGWSRKIGATTYRDEPHQALNPLILSHSSILSPASTHC